MNGHARYFMTEAVDMKAANILNILD